MDPRPGPPRQARRDPEVTAFANELEKVVIDTVEGGKMTKDLSLLIGKDEPWQTTDEFLDTLSENLAKSIAAK
nr:hypothetical protein GCM10025732_12700 [Glycomyces mayteni]